MNNFIVFEKDSLNKVKVNSQKIVLNEASIVHTKMHRADVAEFVQDGNNLLLKLKDGNVITIENFLLMMMLSQTWFLKRVMAFYIGSMAFQALIVFRD